jgi:hypothetical protein
MKPYPFELLNHLTVPCTYFLLLTETWMFLLADKIGTNAAASCNKLRGVYQNEAFSQENIRISLCAQIHAYSSTKTI